jgi:DNA-binding GntR family transcriptional regulator
MANAVRRTAYAMESTGATEVHALLGGRTTKAAQIAEELREAIACGEIAPGTRLQQSVLAARFSTSITPVREALRQLQAEGLLVGEPHRGVAVASPDIDQITSIYVMRRLVEPFAARHGTPRLSRLDFDRARDLNEQLAASYSVGDDAQARRLNREFHWVFYKACGMTTLVSEIDRLWAAFPWAAFQVRRGRTFRSVEEHEELVQAGIENDQAAIQSLFEAHIASGYAALVEELETGGTMDPFEAT